MMFRGLLVSEFGGSGVYSILWGENVILTIFAIVISIFNTIAVCNLVILGRTLSPKSCDTHKKLWCVRGNRRIYAPQSLSSSREFGRNFHYRDGTRGGVHRFAGCL